MVEECPKGRKFGNEVFYVFFCFFFAVVVVLLAFVCLFVLCRLVVIQILCVLGSDTEKWCRRGSCVSTSTVVTTPERRRGVLV